MQNKWKAELTETFHRTPVLHITQCYSIEVKIISPRIPTTSPSDSRRESVHYPLSPTPAVPLINTCSLNSPPFIICLHWPRQHSFVCHHNQLQHHNIFSSPHPCGCTRRILTPPQGRNTQSISYSYMHSNLTSVYVHTFF